MNKLIYFLVIKDLINNLDNYDVIHIHYFNPIYTFFAKDIRRKSKILCVSYWGSDFYRVSNKERDKQRKILDLADVITFTNDRMEKDFLNYHNDVYKDKIEICRFGLKSLEYINIFENNIEFMEKEEAFYKKYNIEKDCIYITCGYNSIPAQQHEDIIKQISTLNKEYKRNIIFLFPMTYGDMEYKNKIKQMLSSTDFKYVVFEDYMGHDEIAVLKKISDIMIHVQATDQFSGSMQEELYAGNIVVNGNWLRYDILKQMGGFFLEINNMNEINDKLIYSIEHLEELKKKCRVNKKIIWELSSWDSNIEKWWSIYNNTKLL